MLADEGKAKAVAFDEIDKAIEEKKRGITIATIWNRTLLVLHNIEVPCKCHSFVNLC